MATRAVATADAGRVHVDMQIADLRVLLRLPTKRLPAGCNFTAAAMLLQPDRGRLRVLLQRLGEDDEGPPAGRAALPGRPGGVLPVGARGPWPQRTGRACLWKYSRNPLAHNLGLDEPVGARDPGPQEPRIGPTRIIGAGGLGGAARVGGASPSGPWGRTTCSTCAASTGARTACCTAVLADDYAPARRAAARQRPRVLTDHTDARAMESSHQATRRTLSNPCEPASRASEPDGRLRREQEDKDPAAGPPISTVRRRR